MCPRLSGGAGTEGYWFQYTFLGHTDSQDSDNH